jgi:hypothetical protein
MGYGMRTQKRGVLRPMSVKPKSAEVVDLIEKLDRGDLEKLVRSLLSNGVALSFHGKRTAMEIARRVRPRVMRREPRLHVGPVKQQAADSGPSRTVIPTHCGQRSGDCGQLLMSV